MMQEFIKADLGKEEVSEFHQKMLQHCKGLVEMSRSAMDKYYHVWDCRDQAYRGERVADKEDKKAAERGEPEKIVAPLSYAQIQTFVAFIIALYKQRRYFYELNGYGPDDQRAAKLGEALLARDLAYNKFTKILYQLLLNIGRFGIGIIKHCWVRELQTVYKEVEVAPEMQYAGKPFTPAKKELQKVDGVKFLGNKLVSVSPYNFFPDTRFPLTRFKEGEFVASEDVYTKSYVYQRQKEGVFAGVEYIKAMTEEVQKKRRWFKEDMTSALTTPMVTSHRIMLTEVQVEIIPSQFMIGETPLGKEEYPVKYLVTYANDQRIVQCEPLSFMHGEYTYEAAQMSPDEHRLINESIAGMVAHLQDVITWFINSHITNVRKVISNKLVVDPAGVEMEDIRNRNAVIRLKSTARERGVDTFVKQLEVRDVTAGHVRDVGELEALLQTVTGINETLLGQFTGGRRSAQEARNVGNAAANRLKLVAQLIYDDMLEPLGRNMLSNLRDGLDEETYVKIFGGMPGMTYNGLAEYQQFVPVDKAKLIGNYDFEVFDATLPSEKRLIADTMTELLKSVIQNPESVGILGFDPKKLLMEIAELRGIKYPENFMVPPTPELILQQPGVMQALIQLGPEKILQAILMFTQQQGMMNGQSGTSQGGQSQPAQVGPIQRNGAIPTAMPIGGQPLVQ